MAKLRGKICKPKECKVIKLAGKTIDNLKKENKILKDTLNKIQSDLIQDDVRKYL